MEKHASLFCNLVAAGFVLSGLPGFATTTGDAQEGNHFFFNQSGPGGGACLSLAFDPNDANSLWVGSDVGGIFVSRDNGESFTAKNLNLPDPCIAKILVNPDDSNIVLAATLSGVARSTDGGDHWTLCRIGFPPTLTGEFSAPVKSIAWGPGKNLVHAAIGLMPHKAAVCTDGNRGLIYRSSDNGQTWAQKSGVPIPSDANFQDIQVRPDNNRVILAASDKGLLGSTNGGDSWAKITAGLTRMALR